MKPKDFFGKALSARLWLNLLAMLLVVVLLCVGAKLGIDAYTHHGEKISIPDVRHKLYSDAEHVLEGAGLRVVVSGTGYDKTLPAECVLSQSPEPGMEVKADRVVYVMINSSLSPTLTVPDIIENCSYREARARLISLGFKVGPAEYVAGEKDWVYGLKSKGKNLRNGDKVPVNDVVIIQVGDGMRDMDDSVIYADPELFIDSYGGSNSETYLPGVDYEIGGGQDSGDDDFEVVTAPE